VLCSGYEIYDDKIINGIVRAKFGIQKVVMKLEEKQL
jgi:hypothetical protein